ncbi:MAG TPA: TonB-dependent receptor [Longimicrobiales bacterium]
MRSSRSGPRFLLLCAALIATAFALPADAAAQTGTVTGVVEDSATGGPVEGAQVQLAGTDIGGLTASNGRFLLTNVPVGSYTLRVTHVAYSAHEQAVAVAAGQTTVVTINARPTAVELAELVVVGYGERRRLEVTSAIETVSGDEIANTPIASIDAAMQGRAAGVQVVQNAGNPGNAPTVRVRGSASISADNQPLYVVDGVPILRDDYSQLGMGGQNLSGVTGLNPDEIESIDLLKDASATAIYGSRGSNGVVLITTRRGRSGQPRVEFSAYSGFQEAERRIDLLSAEQYAEFMNEASTNEGGDAVYIPGVADRVSTDWQEAILRQAPVQNYHVGMSGGVDRLRYYVSGSLFDQEGIVVGSAYQRASGRVNLDFGVNDRLDLRTSLSVSREENDRVQGDGSLYSVVSYALAESPLVPVYRNNGQYTGPSDGLVYYNPVGLALAMPTDVLTLRSIGSADAIFRAGGGVTLNGRVGYDVLSLREFQWQSPEVEGPYPSSVGGVAKQGYNQNTRWLAEGFGTWRAPLPVEHDLTITAGSSVELTDYELNFIRGEGFTNLDNHQIRNAALITDQDGNFGESNLVSVFSRAEWSLLDRYFASASVRGDGSSRFGPNNKWGVFPAVSVGWLITDEGWFPELGFLPTLRLRASWGETGNSSIGDYPYQGLFGPANYGGVGGIAPSSAANHDLKWETTTETNFGFEAGLFAHRATLSFDVYDKETTDLLLNRPITGVSGFNSIYANVGSVSNSGWELGLRTTNLDLPDVLGGLRWTSELNVAHNSNEVTGLFDDQPFNTGERSINRVEVGEELGAFHTYRFDGVDPATGNAIYFDRDGDGAITDDDRIIVGSPHPDWFGGFTNQLAAGPFDVTLFLTFSQGAEIFNAMRLFADDGGYSEDNKFADVLDRWQQPGDETDVPRAGASSGARQISSRFIEDASYVRIQELTFGWRIPPALHVGGIDQARLFVTINNLHTFTDYSGYSPDVNSNGADTNASLGTDFYAYPLARTVSIGITGEL